MNKCFLFLAKKILFTLFFYFFVESTLSQTPYSWENNRDCYPESKDLVLMYGGGSHRNYQWDSNLVIPYVTYIDRWGNEHWMFDSFLFLEIKDGNGVSFATGYTSYPAKQSDWKGLVNYYFQKNYAVGALDKAIGEAIKRIGAPPTKRKIIIGIPEPIKTLTNWGTVEKERMLDFTKTQDRVDACIWYIDYVRKKMSEGSFQNIELAGFYWIAEEASNSRAIVAPIAEYLNDLKYSFNWIPYFNSPGWNDWSTLQFNYAYLQPNYFFKEPLIENRLDEACRNALNNNMDMELEFDERILTKNKSWHNRLDNYIDAFTKYGIWESKRIAYYQGSRALFELSVSADKEDNAVYHRFCEKVISRTSSKKVEINWSFCNANTPPNNLLEPISKVSLISGATTRNFSVGKMNGYDRLFIFSRVGDGKPKILIYNPTNGSYIDSLKTGGVISPSGNGNLISIGDGGLTEDGVLLISNIVGASENNFKVYMWQDENQSKPEVVINCKTKSDFPLGRFGDKITITGNFSKGTAKIFATNKYNGLSNIVYWDMTEHPFIQGQFVFNHTPKELFDVYGKGLQSSIAHIPNVGYYYKESEQQIVQYDLNGDSIGVSSSSVVRGWGTSVGYIGKDGNDDLLVYFKYRSKATNPAEAVQERADILRIFDGNIANSRVIATTPSLGPEYNLNGWGDVFARIVGKDIEVFTLSATNGIGKFTVKNALENENTLKRKENYIGKSVFWKNGDYIVVEGARPKLLQLINTKGQIELMSENSHAIKTDNLKGIFFLRIIIDSNRIETRKIII